MIHKELGNTDDDEKYLFYEPKDFDLWKGSGVMQFPFRRDTFITSPSKAKLALGWTSKHTVQNDIAAEIAEYKASSDAKKEYGLDELRYDMEVTTNLLINL